MKNANCLSALISAVLFSVYATTIMAQSIEMVYVEGGVFRMGSENGKSNEKPIHEVEVGSYYIGKYEVTQKQWDAVMGNNPSGFKGDNLPVENVSWNDIQEFLKRLNKQTGKAYRLPTEAEWEYAARGGKASKGYAYSGSEELNNVAWYMGNSGNTTHKVGMKQANELGIYDMSGNVLEWCADWYGNYTNSHQSNLRGRDNGSSRVLRGGSWYFYDSFCRIAYRDYYFPDYRSNSYGFRLALSGH